MISNVAEIDILDKYTNETLYLRLYSNDITPSETDTAASFTEVSGGGYDEIELLAAERTITGGNPSSCVWPLKTFTFTGAITATNLYGYYIVDGAGLLKGAERFPGAVVPFEPSAGREINITPKLFA